MSIAKFQLIGNLTRDAELSHEPGKKPRTVFDLAVNKVWYTGEEKQEKTNYYRVTSFGTIAENAGKFLGKGSKVYVEGDIEPTKYEKNGEDVYGYSFIATHIEYCDTKPPAGNDK